MSIIPSIILPKAVKTFLIRSLVIFLVWKITYHTILYPIRFPDKQLTYVTTYLTKQLLSINYPTSKIEITEQLNPLPKTSIYLNDRKVVGFADGCNGLELYVLFLGFIFAFDSKIGKVFKYGSIGVILIFVLNTLRCYAITLLNIHNAILSEVAHHYIFKLIIYGIMFLLWINYTKNKLQDEV